VSAGTLVLAAVAGLGWSIGLASALALRHHRMVAADAEHELRGAATAITLAAERMERGGGVAELAAVARLELARMDAALCGLGGPGEGGARRSADIDAGRLAQVLGNVIDNAAEHGIGPATVRSWREGAVVRLEVANRAAEGRRRAGKRGRGIAIAERAAQALGGRLRVESEGGVTRAVVELPAQGSPAEGAEGPHDDLPRAA
jgi:hypothetical protein